MTALGTSAACAGLALGAFAAGARHAAAGEPARASTLGSPIGSSVALAFAALLVVAGVSAAWDVHRARLLEASASIAAGCCLVALAGFVELLPGLDGAPTTSPTILLPVFAMFAFGFAAILLVLTAEWLRRRSVRGPAVLRRIPATPSVLFATTGVALALLAFELPFRVRLAPWTWGVEVREASMAWLTIAVLCAVIAHALARAKPWAVWLGLTLVALGGWAATTSLRALRPPVVDEEPLAMLAHHFSPLGALSRGAPFALALVAWQLLVVRSELARRQVGGEPRSGASAAAAWP